MKYQQRGKFNFQYILTCMTFGSVMLVGCQDHAVSEEAKVDELKVVFVTGDEEDRSEESMPMLASLLQKSLDAEVSICYSLDSSGYVDPNNTKSISGLEALTDADLMVIFTRFRALPDDQLKLIDDFAQSGKPMVGFRTATHAFFYEDDSSKIYYNEEWPTKVFGQKWITHHGHFEDGHGRLTDVEIIEGKEDHPIVRGVTDFEAYSWLYHVDGGNDSLYGDCDPLLLGTSLRSNHQEAGRLDQYPLTNPVAWTKTYQGTGGTSRVFFTTLGHPFDFKETSMRKLALNGIFWALGKENEIPQEGLNADFGDYTYDPNNSGFGEKFKKELKPILLNE